MSKIRALTYRLDIYNLQTKIVSFADQEKWLKEVVVTLAVSMNVNTKNSQIKHCSCPCSCCDINSQLEQFTDQKKHLKNYHELKVIF